MLRFKYTVFIKFSLIIFGLWLIDQGIFRIGFTLGSDLQIPRPLVRTWICNSVLPCPSMQWVAPGRVFAPTFSHEHFKHRKVERIL